MSPSDLPPIQVIVGPSTEHDGPWYFSLNNRRLWVLKRCRDEGLLPNNEIYVRVRKPKSDQEAERYSLQNCALEAKIIPEKQKAKAQQDSTMKEVVGDATNGAVNDVVKGVIALKEEENPDNEDATSSSDEHSESSDDLAGPSNRFSALLL